MKKVITHAIRRLTSKPRGKGSILLACRQVCGAATGLRESLSTFRAILIESGDHEAAQVVRRLENLAQRASQRIGDRLIRLAGPGASYPSVKLGPNTAQSQASEWIPKSWTGLHAELLTLITRSMEICRGALNSSGITFDHVTHLALVQVLEVFEEMLWVTESTPSKSWPRPEPKQSPEQAKESTVGTIKVKSCALMNCTPTDTLMVIPGKLELSPLTAQFIWFVPLGGSVEKRIQLDRKLAKRLISVHPERQPLFRGCTHILELSTDELNGLGAGIHEFIERPLLDFSGNTPEFRAMRS